MPPRLIKPVKFSIPNKPKRTTPVWEGPESIGSQGGVTFSLLSRFIVCRERFRLYVVDGLRPADRWDHKMGYGNMWHVCEEALAAKRDWKQDLTWYVNDQLMKYPLSQELIIHWRNVCICQFPVYVDYWSKHRDVVSRTPLLQEAVFDVPYQLPSGRTVRLRGKFDSVDLIGSGKSAGIYLQENKTKGDIRETQIKDQLTMDLQVMMYLTALTDIQRGKEFFGQYKFLPLKGVRYNVVKRSVTIKRGEAKKLKKGYKPAETVEAYYKRVGDYYRKNPQDYFMRWQAEVTPGDIENFQKECLNPLLEQLCEWWEWITCRLQTGPWEEPGNSYHWRHPFGVRNMLNEGGESEMDEYLRSGSEASLRRVDNLFTELV